MKCPKCKKKIDWLRNYSKVEKIYSFDADTYNELDEIFETNENEDFECPECGEVLTHNEDKARKMLLG